MAAHLLSLPLIGAGCFGLFACCSGTTLQAQNRAGELRYLIPAESFAEPSPRENNAITVAICEGKAKGSVCDTCPGDSSKAGIGFSLKRVILGRFVTPGEMDALVTAFGCEQMHASVGWGFLVSRRAGKWASHEEVLGLELDRCHRMQFRSGRQLLLCEDYRMASWSLLHSVTAIFAKDESIVFRNLVTAADTTGVCEEQSRPQKAQIDKIEFRDLNGDGIEDVSFAVSFGALGESQRRRELCEEAKSDKPGALPPQPDVMKPYQIDYLFDGVRFKLTEKSVAASKLFQLDE
ncbi:MAG: hypothetical protein ABJF23_06520 [Bryobacteraceae bacterium]